MLKYSIDFSHKLFISKQLILLKNLDLVNKCFKLYIFNIFSDKVIYIFNFP